MLGSIPLPSYVIAPVEPGDNISRRYAFKVTDPQPPRGCECLLYAHSNTLAISSQNLHLKLLHNFP